MFFSSEDNHKDNINLDLTLKNSIAVLPEINNDDVSQCSGICSDYIKDYKE